MQLIGFDFPFDALIGLQFLLTDPLLIKGHENKGNDHQINPLTPRSDKHVISSLKHLYLIQQTCSENNQTCQV